MTGRWWVPAGLVVSLALGAWPSGSSAASASAPVRARFALPASTSAADAQQVARRMEQRLRALGVADVDVRAKGDTVVVRGAPTATDVAPLVAGRGELEFRPVVAIYTGGDLVPGVTDTEDATLLPSRNANGFRFAVGPPAISGGVTGARASFVAGGSGHVVNLRFDRSAQRRFDALARRSIAKAPPQNSVALVVDGVVQSAPSFQATAFPGGVQISSDFTKREAQALAAALNSGPYPVKVRRLGDR